MHKTPTTAAPPFDKRDTETFLYMRTKRVRLSHHFRRKPFLIQEIHRLHSFGETIEKSYLEPGGQKQSHKAKRGEIRRRGSTQWFTFFIVMACDLVESQVLIIDTTLQKCSKRTVAPLFLRYPRSTSGRRLIAERIGTKRSTEFRRLQSVTCIVPTAFCQQSHMMKRYERPSSPHP